MGEYSVDKRHGCGMYTSRTGAIYKGEYTEGRREGWGEYVNSNVDKYEGPFVNNERHGNGVVTLAASEETDPVRMKAAQKWGALWFKDVEKDPLNADAPLEIDPTRVFVGNYEAGVMVSRRPYDCLACCCHSVRLTTSMMSTRYMRRCTTLCPAEMK